MGFIGMNTYAKNYTITFTGSGKTSIVESVIVQNITQNTTVTVPAGNTLDLYDAANAVDQVSETDETICVYPNFAEGTSTVSFFAKQAGATQINAFSLDGRKVAGINARLQTGENSFKLSLPKGSYLIRVTGAGYTYNTKMIQPNSTLSKSDIVYIGAVKSASYNMQKSKSSALSSTVMNISEGDHLLYKGVSGNYSVVVTDVPTSSKTIDFNFVACIDGEGNNYSVVKIGEQIWMVENLRTTKYNDGQDIPNFGDQTTWKSLTTPSYCYLDNNPTNKNIYGALYNWFTVNTTVLAPVGWHVPTDAEWAKLENYLMANGYNYDGTIGGNAYAKALSATTNWCAWNTDSGEVGAIGNRSLTRNNSTGFTALPGGFRNTYATYEGGTKFGYWWSSTQDDATFAYPRYLSYNYGNMGRLYNDKHNGLSVRCIKDTMPVTIPSLSTILPFAITSTTAKCGGNIINPNGAAIAARGVCWSTSVNPSIALSTKTSDALLRQTFSSSITELTPNTTYYVRSYATNSEGTAYGNEFSFTTPETVTDLDGNVYNTVVIGTQTWMLENLKTTKYNDGSAIPNITDKAAWVALTTPAYCWYNNNTNTFGALYNWYTVNTDKLAPAGWHVPADFDWSTLGKYMNANGYNSDGTNYGDRYAKSLAANTSWYADISGIGGDLTTNNRSGFTALPGGYRGTSGTFYHILDYGRWWTSTEVATTPTNAWDIDMYYNTLDVTSVSWDKHYGYSVRCLKDNYNLPTISTTEVSGIAKTTANCGGNLSNNGGATITDRGVCWSNSPNPTIALSTKTSDGTETGTIFSSMTNLNASTTYYVRAYATNRAGTAYGNELSFTTANWVIGDSYLGGRIAYLDASGIHGFVCALTGQVALWNNKNVYVNTGATNTVLETTVVYGISKSGGRKNTDAIIAAQGAGNYAAAICAAMTDGGAAAGDWYLPSKGELYQMYAKKGINLCALGTDSYWSSSESQLYSAWSLDFSDGTALSTSKDYFYGCSVRAIRAF
jgi:uncharacterized protein (TIGR02145 family)